MKRANGLKNKTLERDKELKQKREMLAALQKEVSAEEETLRLEEEQVDDEISITELANN